MSTETIRCHGSGNAAETLDPNVLEQPEMTDFVNSPRVSLLKNTHLPRYARLPALRRTQKYASFLESSQALHPDVFDQPEITRFVNSPRVPFFPISNGTPHGQARGACI